FEKPKTLNEVMEVALYYGFTPTVELTIKQIDKDCVRKLFEEESVSKHHADPSFEISTEEKSALLRYYDDNNLIAESQPIMLSYGETALFDKSNKSKSAPREQYTNLQVLGSSKSVSELILIKTALAVLSDSGIRDACVDINSIGDKDSTNRFAKELNSYYRKNISKMPSHCRQLFKKNTFSLLKCNKEECCRAINEETPKAITFLSEASRQHFKEVLEGLEILEIPYRINNTLIPDKRHCSQTVFEITRGTENKREVLAYGSRYDGLAKKLGQRKDIPAIGLRISSKRLTRNANIPAKTKASIFFFIQLGFEAKLKGLDVIEILRKSKILVSQSLNRDMLGGQIAMAERMKMPYTLIMGKKESMDNTVMVRNINTRSQEIVPTENLAVYLKSLKLSKP
ncbi:MAG: His/Gly/Thr/Pro-type tRNA ligase C-terminal domain-containing protein, partial [Patescibacteria group bacterium]